jgi:hypothetical protein
MLCIEAKGDDTFRKEQLARKQIRLDRILVSSGARDRRELQCKLVLITPREPGFSNWQQFTQTLNGGKLSIMRKYLESHSSAVMDELKIVKLKGFPETLRRVTRTRSTDSIPKEFTHWKIKRR